LRLAPEREERARASRVRDARRGVVGVPAAGDGHDAGRDDSRLLAELAGGGGERVLEVVDASLRGGGGVEFGVEYF
jgi:hypothetical protein